MFSSIVLIQTSFSSSNRSFFDHWYKIKCFKYFIKTDTLLLFAFKSESHHDNLYIKMPKIALGKTCGRRPTQHFDIAQPLPPRITLRTPLLNSNRTIATSGPKPSLFLSWSDYATYSISHVRHNIFFSPRPSIELDEVVTEISQILTICRKGRCCNEVLEYQEWKTSHQSYTLGQCYVAISHWSFD